MLLFYIFFLLFVTFSINYILKKKNFLISETGDRHQKFASVSKVPLSGGIFLFIGILYFLNENILSLILFSFLIFILGIFSDLKLINSAKIRFLFQILIVLFFIFFNDIQVLDTRISTLDKFLTNNMINYLFVSFCVLIVVNGSNFIDGLNTLSIGYYLLIALILWYLNLNFQIDLNNIKLSVFLILLLIVFILNLFNRLYLGDSGSYLIGFIFSVFLISLYNWNLNLSPFFIILLLWYPCYETLFSIIRKRILNKSTMKPDSEHLHQLIFFLIKKKFNLKILSANILSANIINIYNLLIFLFATKFIYNSKAQVMFILLNLIIYTVTYFKTLKYKNKIK
jgi:UDP-N-acetylmuramyl pentapeptide phosphotransferase/UDP-N-acetylglucosamine-1-phosphate transferase